MHHHHHPWPPDLLLLSSRPHQNFKNSNNSRIMEQHNFTEQEKKVEEDDDVEWLKLGLGLGISNTTDTSSSSCNKNIISHGSSNPVLYSSSLPSSSSSSQGLIITHHQEVGLRLGLGLLERGSQLGIVGSMVEPSRASYHHHHHHRNSLLGLSSSSLSGHCNYYHHHIYSSNNNDDDGGDNNGMNRLRPQSSSSCRIDSQGLPISVPYIDQSHHYPHHHNGVWFTLRSSTNRSGEALPQIPKAYIRVRDENMTVLMVKRYLVMKLGLSNETEIDISCMGESLSHIQTLKQVRDGVWLPRLIESLNSTTLSSLGDSHDMSLHHIMSLIYRKHCFSNH